MPLDQAISSVQVSDYGTTRGGERVSLYTLTNRSGAVAKLINYGATITELWMPDRNGKLDDVILGCPSIEGYETVSPCFGSTMGRVAGRISGAKFSLAGKEYALDVNEGANSIHGGNHGYHTRIWDALPSGEASVRFHLLDSDGWGGYPGNLNVWVEYTLTDDNVLRISYEAKTDATTVVVPTNHAYFNLRDAGASDVLGHQIRFFSELYLPNKNDAVPTGEVLPAKGTAFDFSSLRSLGENISLLAAPKWGFNNTFVILGKRHELRPAVEVVESESGRRMEVWTTEPGVHFYTCAYLPVILGKQGIQYGPSHAFCLESQNFPDAPNQQHFPSPVLSPGEVYRQITEHRFSTVE